LFVTTSANEQKIW